MKYQDVRRQSVPDDGSLIEYIRDMSGQLRKLAQDRNLNTLSYFLDMAHNQANIELCANLDLRERKVATRL